MPPGVWFVLLVAAASWGLLCTFILAASYYTREWVLPAWWWVCTSAMAYAASALCVLAIV
jgi:hypothetical protein